MCGLSQDAIDAILSRGGLFEVGGAVRDSLLKIPVVKDRDYLVTGIPFDSLTGLLNGFGRVDLVGKSFGVIKFTQFKHDHSLTFDIALPRREFSTGAAHTDFEVEFDPDLPIEDDLARRDFTVNAIARSLKSNELVDPLDGLMDIKNRQLRMTSTNSFVDDPLRMLRAVQFAARFGFEIEAATLASMKKNAELIKTVSAERIAEELVKLLELAELPSQGFRLMERTGLLEHFLPELKKCVGVTQPGGFHKHDVFEHTLHTMDAAPPRKRMRLAALFHDITKPQHRRLNGDGGSSYYGHDVSAARVVGEVMLRLRFSKDLTKEVTTLVKRHMFTTDVTDKGRRRLIRWVGEDLIFDLIDLRRADVIGLGFDNDLSDVDQFELDIRHELSQKPPMSVTDLAIDGRRVMKELQLSPSPIIGLLLNHLLEAVLDDPKLNEPEPLLDLTKQYLIEHNNSLNKASNEDKHE